MYDLIISGGTVIDGTGKAAFCANIGISDGKISCIRTGLAGAKKVIDATGLIVAPGFIDSHSHADSKILEFPEQKEKLEQGVTTSVAGQCGGSAAPLNENSSPDKLDLMTHYGLYRDVCHTMETFLNTLKDEPLGANFMCFVGHGTIRRVVMGDDSRAPTECELEQMQNYLRDAFEHGAAGLSFGLFYAPGCYATIDEAVSMAKIAGEYNRPISAHIRSESDRLVEAVEEFINIVRRSGVRGILSHHKAVQCRNWGKVNTTMELLQKAVDAGLDIYCDVYPYCASSTRFSQAFVPHTWRAGGTTNLLNKIADPILYKQNKRDFYEKHGSDFNWILVSSCPSCREYEGLTLELIAQSLNMDPFDAAMKLIIDSNDTCNACFFSINEEDLKSVMGWHRTMICTDSGMAGSAKNFHPRMVGSFPRTLGRYVREQGVVSWEEMIRKMTALPAYVYGLSNKGLIKEGYDADICIFDADKIIDKADFINCCQRAEGLNYVILGGHVVVKDAVYNGVRMGRLLKANS